MNALSRRSALLLGLGTPALLAACATPMPTTPPDPSGLADPEMLSLLQSLASLGGQPIETLTPPEARRQPTLADAVKKRLTELGRPTTPRPLPLVKDTMVPGPGGPLMARVYSPAQIPMMPGQLPLPLIVYYHGGGWVIADIDVYDASCRALAADTGAVVLAVHYRQGPETKFPGAHDDAYAAYVWAMRNAGELGADPSRIALVGESAGGNLAIATALSAKATGVTLPRALGLVYPVAGTDLTTPSYQRFANAKPLNKPMVEWFVRHYTNSPADLQDPRLNVYAGADLRGLPPTVIVNAQIDPLADDGLRLAQALQRANVPVARQEYAGVTHEFFGADAVLSKAGEAQRWLAGELRRVLLTPAPVEPQPAMRRRRPVR
ncbi:alpha/beta hydrolase [Roseomonas sp. OT10]|uniref:alpha/beta hydrolase n=1 Tax=Roseomonas cutis TaxID=2897332 RepID=UPI001E2F6E50|nr:alpha/beta hydrolase [Roseomonas sp. OT10]UFN50767.1 alpha/beta hydrolase [Roseomonas sp. OT10]